MANNSNRAKRTTRQPRLELGDTVSSGFWCTWCRIPCLPPDVGAPHGREPLRPSGFALRARAYGALLQAQGFQQAARLGPGFIKFALGNGIGHDARPCAEYDVGAALNGGGYLRATDQDIQIQVAVAVEPAEGAGIGAARLAFQLGDDLHAAHLGASGDGAAGK